MQTFSDVITAFGGYAKIAEAVGCPPGTASAWKSRQGIPHRYWSRIAAEAQARGINSVTLEALADIAAKPQSERAA